MRDTVRDTVRDVRKDVPVVLGPVIFGHVRILAAPSGVRPDTVG
jgi:hypothetical protein